MKRLSVSFGGVPVVVSEHVPPPREPTPGEVGVRIVRHGLAYVLEQLGEKVGPAMDAPVYTTYLVAGNVLVNPEHVTRLDASL